MYIESSMNQSHFFSDCDKFPMYNKVDEDEEMDVMTGPPHSNTSVTNEQEYETHPDL